MTQLLEDVTPRADSRLAGPEDVTPARTVLQEFAHPRTDSHEAAPMTDAEYEQFVSQWIGIPYQLNGEDPKIGLDCRTLAVKFLRAQGINIKDTDGEPLPETIDALDVQRYEKAVQEAGVAVSLTELQRNDIVYYFNKLGQLHVGVWLGYDRILTTGQPYNSFIYKIKRQHLKGAVRGSSGVMLDDRAVPAPPGHPPVIAVLAAIGTVATLGVATGVGAVIIGAVVVGAAIAAVSFGIGALSSGRKAFNFDGSPSAGLSASPRYAFDGARNIRSNQYPVPLIYSGLGLRILDTFEIWNSGQGAQTQKRIVVLCEGEVAGMTEVKLNGDDIANFPGSSATAYTGTPSQGVDSRAAGTNVVGLRNTAYLALTLAASDKLSGDPIITCKLTGGRKIKIWNGTDWNTAAAAASGNPAAAIRDYLTLTRERGGCGFPESVIDDASFGAVYNACEVTVTNLDGTTEPRARLDMMIDTFRPWLDNLQDMLATFGGFLTTDGRKFFLRVEKSESPIQAFTQDNVRDVTYQTFSKDDRPNRLIAVYIDPTASGKDARTRTSIDDLTDQDKNPRGIVPREVSLLGISRQTQAIREITKILNDVRVNWFFITLTADIDAIAIEAGDVFTLTHPILGDGVTAYQYRATRILENQDHSRTIIGKAYNASVFNDQMEQQAVTLNYTPPLNPFTPVADVTGLSVQAVGFIQTDGNFVSNLQVSWIEPVEKTNLKMYALEWSENGAAYVERDNVFPGTTTAILPNAKIGATYQMKVRTVSKYDVKSTGAISGSVIPNGDTNPPLDVSGFDASQLGDEIRLTWNANPDIDIWGYEIREGGTSWASASFIDGPIQATKYTIRQFAAGTKTYRIKAIDASGNYSLNAASDSLVSSSPSDSNILFRFDLFNRSLAGGMFSADAEAAYSNEFAPTYHRNTVSLKTTKTLENNTDTWETLQTTLNWDTQARVLTTENYTSEEVDIGSIQTGVVSISHKEFMPDGTVTLEWAYGTTPLGASPTYVAFSEGVYTVRYFRVRAKIKTNTTANAVRIYELNVIVDVKDLIDRGSSVAVAATGTTMSFNKSFTQAPAIQITTLNNPYVPYITAKSATSFTVKLRDPVTNTDVAGTIDWLAKGF